MVPKKIISGLLKHVSKKKNNFVRSEMFFVDPDGKLKQISQKDQLLKLSKSFHETSHVIHNPKK